MFEVCRKVVPLMETSNAGRIVNMASLAGKEGTVGPSLLDRAAAELPGLHDGPLSADDKAAIALQEAAGATTCRREGRC